MPDCKALRCCSPACVNVIDNVLALKGTVVRLPAWGSIEMQCAWVEDLPEVPGHLQMSVSAEGLALRPTWL